MRAELNGNGFIADFTAFRKSCNGIVIFVESEKTVVNKAEKLEIRRCCAGEGVECINFGLRKIQYTFVMS